MVMMAWQRGHCTPDRLIVPAPIRLSCSRRRAGLPSPGGHVDLDLEHNAGALRVRRHRQPRALGALLREPAGLEQRDRRPAALAADGARPQIRDGRRRHPARIPRVLQIDRIELRVKRTDVGVALRVRGQQRRRPRLERRTSRPQRPIRRVGRIAAGESTPRRRQHPASPRADLPREIGLQRRTGTRQLRFRGLIVVAEAELGELALQHPALHTLRLQEGGHEVAVPQCELRQRPGLANELPGVVERALQDEPRDRIDVDRRDLAAEPHRLQRDCAPARERIHHPRGAATKGVPNPRAEPVEILSVLPLPVQDPALCLALPSRHRPPAHALVLDGLDDLARHPPIDRLPLSSVAGVR